MGLKKHRVKGNQPGSLFIETCRVRILISKKNKIQKTDDKSPIWLKYRYGSNAPDVGSMRTGCIFAEGRVFCPGTAHVGRRIM